jgi:hypothetical protein
MHALTKDVRWTAEQISRELGWEAPPASVRKIDPKAA